MFLSKKYFVRVFWCGLLLAVLSVSALSDAAAPSPSTPSPASYGMTSGRLVATLSAVLALIGVVMGGIALARPLAPAYLRMFAIVAGLIGVVVGGIRVMTASGIGTGGGRAGAIVALVLGLIAVALGGFAFARSRRNE